MLFVHFLYTPFHLLHSSDKCQFDEKIFFLVYWQIKTKLYVLAGLWVGFFLYILVGRKGKATASLVRPLPWIVFLPTLIILRYTRVILSLAAICLGFEEIEASTMVTHLHNARRYCHKLRRDAQPHSSTQPENRSFYPEMIGKALVNGISSVCAWPICGEAKVRNNQTKTLVFLRY